MGCDKRVWSFILLLPGGLMLAGQKGLELSSGESLMKIALLGAGVWLIAKTFLFPDFDSAVNAVDMTVDAGAASIRVR